MNTFREFSFSALLLLFGLNALNAQFMQQPPTPQVDVSNDELKQFAAAVQQVQMINMQTQQTMVKTVEDNGIELDRFNEIMKSQQNPDIEVTASEEEMNTIEEISKQLEGIQMKAQQSMQEKITDTGLSIERYQQIANVVQNSPELQQKLQQLIQGQYLQT